jgi:hypothetical protein
MIERQSLRGTDYHTLAIIGNQSTGKSTILNKLFMTDFETMPIGQGVQQTTKGINASMRSNMLILDIEGADSQVRGEDGEVLESKLALFSLAVAEVVIFNIKQSEISRKKGSNSGLLKKVFEANLKLFDMDKKKRIVYFIRDFVEGSYSFDALREQLLRTMTQVYSEVANSQRSMDEAFDIQFFCLPNFFYQEEAFDESVRQLQPLFLNPRQTGYLFADLAGNLPLEGLPQYYGDIWGIIERDEDINIPSQKVLISETRCSQNKLEALEEYKDLLRSVRDETPGMPLVGQRIQAKILRSLAAYDDKSRSYVNEVYAKHRSELEGLVLQETNALASTRLLQLRDAILNEFRTTVLRALNRSVATSDLKTKLERDQHDYKTRFEKEGEHMIYLKEIIAAELRELITRLKDEATRELGLIGDEQRRVEQVKIDTEERLKREHESLKSVIEEEKRNADHRMTVQIAQQQQENTEAQERIREQAQDDERLIHQEAKAKQEDDQRRHYNEMQGLRLESKKIEEEMNRKVEDLQKQYEANLAKVEEQRQTIIIEMEGRHNEIKRRADEEMALTNARFEEEIKQQTAEAERLRKEDYDKMALANARYDEESKQLSLETEKLNEILKKRIEAADQETNRLIEANKVHEREERQRKKKSLLGTIISVGATALGIIGAAPVVAVAGAAGVVATSISR